MARTFALRRLSLRKAKKLSFVEETDREETERKETDRDSAINPFADDDSCTSSESGDEREQQTDDEQTESGRGKRITTSIRSKLKQRNARKRRSKAEKQTNKAMQRAEAERVQWLAQVAKEQAEEAEKTRQRQLFFFQKGAERSKELMLQHLCAISIQASWRSSTVRRQRVHAGSHREESECISFVGERTPPKAFTDINEADAFKEQEQDNPLTGTKSPTLVSSSLMEIVQQQGMMSP